MKRSVVFVAAAAVLIGGAVGCSSGPVASRSGRAALPPGAAQLTVNGKDVGGIGWVQCAPPVESLTIIKAGDDRLGATVMVSNAEELTVEFVRIRGLNGFTGDYTHGLDGNATVTMTDATYNITGAALGYTQTSTEPMLQPFTMKASC